MSGYQRYKVIIVEDDPMVQSINEGFLLKHSSFELAGIASDAREAKVLIQSLKPDLVLLDVYLPGEHGTEILKWMRNAEILSDVILITADKTSDTAALSRRYGAVDYLVKPFTFDRFSEALERFISYIDAARSRAEGQSAADEIFSIQKSVSRQGSGNLTFDSVMDLLRNNPEKNFTANDVSEKLGISRITARKYLEELENEDFAVMELSYGGVGRPQNIYRLKRKID